MHVDNEVFSMHCYHDDCYHDDCYHDDLKASVRILIESQHCIGVEYRRLESMN